MTPKKTLVFTYGNPSRGDDALGPMFYQRLLECREVEPALERVSLQTDFQLQIEHATDLHGMDEVVFVDASVDCQASYQCQHLLARQSADYTSHSLHPCAVLAVYETIYDHVVPKSFLLQIRGYSFELGESLSKKAEENLSLAEKYLVACIRDGGVRESP